MKDNIYDSVISELVLRTDAATAANVSAARLQLTSSIGLNTVPENSNQNATFTSRILNLPYGWVVDGTTHTITYPIVAAETSSSDDFTGSSVAVILGAAASTYIVTSTVDITDGDTIITLNATLTITAVLPIYYGIKAVPVVSPDSSSLYEMSSEEESFQLTTASPGRLYVAIPTASNGADFKGIQDSNGLLIPVGDFVLTIVGSYHFYYTNYDTQLTGSIIKSFLIIYQATGTLNPALPTI